MSVMLWECSWLSKIYSDSKSRVSEVKNSRNIFTLFLPQSKGPCSKTVRESCPQIRVRLKNNLYLAPRSIGFDGKVFYSLWQEMEPPQLAVTAVLLLIPAFGNHNIKTCTKPNSVCAYKSGQNIFEIEFRFNHDFTWYSNINNPEMSWNHKARTSEANKRNSSKWIRH